MFNGTIKLLLLVRIRNSMSVCFTLGLYDVRLPRTLVLFSLAAMRLSRGLGTWTCFVWKEFFHMVSQMINHSWRTRVRLGTLGLFHQPFDFLIATLFLPCLSPPYHQVERCPYFIIYSSQAMPHCVAWRQDNVSEMAAQALFFITSILGWRNWVMKPSSTIFDTQTLL